MKIGIVTEYYYPSLGGIQEHVYHFAVEALKLGHEVKVITAKIKDHDLFSLGKKTEPGLREVNNDAHYLSPAELQAVDRSLVPVIYVGTSFRTIQNGSVARITLGFNLAKKLSRILAAEQFDILHIHSPFNPTLPLLALNVAKGVTVGTLHTNFKGNFFLRMFKNFCQQRFDKLHGIIAVSKIAAEAVAKYCQINYRVIPNGIDIHKFKPENRPCIPNQEAWFNILWVGRMEPRNGLDRMLKAFILASKTCANLRLIVIGDGPLRKNYEALIPKVLKERILFTGMVKEARPAIYASADLLCVPATIAAFGIILLEGMAAGKPILASAIEGFQEVLTDGREGRLIDTANPEVFSEHLVNLARDPALCAQYGRAGRETALNYSWEKVTEQILTYYTELLGRAKRE